MAKALQVDRKGKLRLEESQLKKQCSDYLRSVRDKNALPVYLVFETHGRRAFSSMGEKGQPDLVAVQAKRWPTNVLLIELKVDDGKLSPAQRAWHLKAQRMGFNPLVIHSLEELKAVL